MSNNELMLSIIVPVYNVKKYINECLDSLISQDISDKEYEIICIDDGSTDGSRDILDEFANKYRNIVVINKSNGGVSSARNCGINKAKGKYIWFVDSDDFITKNILSDIFSVLNNNSPDLLFVKPIAFNDGEDTLKYKEKIIEENETTNEYIDWLWTRLYKKSIIDDSKIRFNTNISFAEDHMFCTMLNPYINKIITYDKVGYFYRRRPNSLSTTATKDKLDILINSSSAFLESGINKTIDYDIARKEVCIMMISVMSTIATFPKTKANKLIKELKERKLFPLKKQKDFSPNYSLEGLNFENRLLTKLKAG